MYYFYLPFFFLSTQNPQPHNHATSKQALKEMDTNLSSQIYREVTVSPILRLKLETQLLIDLKYHQRRDTQSCQDQS